MPLNKPILDKTDIDLNKWLGSVSNRLFFMKEYSGTQTVSITNNNSATFNVSVSGVKADDPSVIVNLVGAPSGLIVSHADITADNQIKVNLSNVSGSTVAEDISFKFMVMKRV